MPIKTKIKAVVNSMTGSPAFLYGTEHELNNLADDSSFPCVYMYPETPVTKKYTLSNAINDSFSVFISFLVASHDVDETSENLEPYVNQAMVMANEFMVKLANYRGSNHGKYFKVKVDQSARTTTLKNKFDVNAVGVYLSLTLQTMYNDNVPVTQSLI